MSNKAYLRLPVDEQSVKLHPDDRSMRRRSQQAKQRYAAIILLILGLWLCFRNVDRLLPCLRGCHRGQHSPSVEIKKNATKIPLEAHVMSKCPDAKDCLTKLVVPAMEKVQDKVDFKLSFIGTVDNKSDAVKCKHGPAECLGNMIILCANKLYSEPKVFLGFANCLISDYAHVPEQGLVEECAMEHGVDFDKVNDCISDEGEGIDLLRQSVQRSTFSNITKSCTVRLNGKIRCIRDGGEWYDCPGGSSVKSLVQDVDKLYNISSSS